MLHRNRVLNREELKFVKLFDIFYSIRFLPHCDPEFREVFFNYKVNFLSDVLMLLACGGKPRLLRNHVIDKLATLNDK